MFWEDVLCVSHWMCRSYSLLRSKVSRDQIGDKCIVSANKEMMCFSCRLLGNLLNGTVMCWENVTLFCPVKDADNVLYYPCAPSICGSDSILAVMTWACITAYCESTWPNLTFSLIFSTLFHLKRGRSERTMPFFLPHFLIRDSEWLLWVSEEHLFSTLFKAAVMTYLGSCNAGGQ